MLNVQMMIGSVEVERMNGRIHRRYHGYTTGAHKSDATIGQANASDDHCEDLLLIQNAVRTPTRTATASSKPTVRGRRSPQGSAADGWFMLQVLRAHQWPDLARAIGRPDWAEDPRFDTPQGWLDHLESDIRPALESWASTRTKRQACDALNAAGVVAGPVANDVEVVADPHLQGRNMLVELPRPDGVEQPVLIPGLPVKFAEVAEGPETRIPWLGEHTDEVLGAELGLGPSELDELRAGGVIA